MARGSSTPTPQVKRNPDDLLIADSTWLDLGQLRALVRKADELGWDDSALISHGPGSSHLTRHDVRVAHLIVIEGYPPEPAESGSSS